MKKVLIITYYWPPSGGAGVQRWLKFVKYLRDFGWEPIVYTVENGEIPIADVSLQKDVPENLLILKQPIWEPYDLYKKFIGQKKDSKINAAFLSEEKKSKTSEKIAVWIRGNFFIPDARKFWIKPSVKYLSGFLEQNKVDAVISSGPPHSMHLIALQLKRTFSFPWMADFRDPWTNIDFYDQLMLTSWADKKHHSLERKVLENADLVLTIGETMKADFEKSAVKKVAVITNGFDQDDITISSIVPDKKFTLAHIGSFVKSRNPKTLWKVLKDLVRENPPFAGDLEIKLVGSVDFEVMQAIKHHNLDIYLNKINYLPHDKVIKLQQESQVLLLLLNNTKNAKGILTGKFFEYLSAKRPILAIGPIDSEVAHILSKTKAGAIVDFEDEYFLKQEILKLYQKYKAGTLLVESEGIEAYSRKNLTKKLGELLDKMVMEHTIVH